MKDYLKTFVSKRAGLLFMGDVAALFASLLLCYWIWDGFEGFENFGVAASFVSLGLLMFFWNKGHYTRKKPFSDEMMEIFQGLGIAFMVMAMLFFLFGLTCVSTAYIGLWGTMLVLIPLARYWTNICCLRLNWTVPMVILGTGGNALEAADALQSERQMGLELQKFLALKPDQVPEAGCLQVLGKDIPVEFVGNDPVATILDMGKPQLVVALETGGVRKNSLLIEKIARTFPNFILFPDLYGLPLYGLEVTHFFRKEVLMLRVHNNLSRRIPRAWKRLFDVVGSLLLLFVLSPLFAYFYVRLKREGGDAFFGHERIGQAGEKFKCYKFRTMVKDADKILKDLLEADPEARNEWDREFKLKNDPRITKIGKFMRESSIDELPQLWNVLVGQMSLVGPRPIIEAEVTYYGDNFNYFKQVKPGMTGLWQVSGRNDTNYEKRVALDVWYVKNWALWYDIVILYQTVGVVLKKSGAY